MGCHSCTSVSAFFRELSCSTLRHYH
jgi:hypothetical protein